MLIRARRSVPVTLGLIGLAAGACQPMRDLDATTQGTPPVPTMNEAGTASGGGAVGGQVGASLGGAGSGAVGTNHGGAEVAAGGTDSATTAGTGGSVGGSEPVVELGGAGSGAGGDSSGGADSVEEPPLAELPNELEGSPVQGSLTFTESTGGGQKFFRIQSPLAAFTLSATSGNLTSLDDRSGGNVVQWVSPGAARPRRVGIVTSPQPSMTTTLDQDSYTARHVRLRCKSDNQAWEWTWDFYPTQATLSLTKAGGAYGFTFSGSPGDQLMSGDEVVPSSGTRQSALGSLLTDLMGPAEWAYLTDSAYQHSLFLIQHGDDELNDRYDALGGDTATWVFGDGLATRAQRRFSLGFFASTEPAKVTGRIQFVIGATP
jgi:hypothetical protein